MRAIAILSIALGVSIATAAECELTSTMATLKKIGQLPSVEECSAATGFSLNPPPGKPTAAQLSQICAVPACAPAIGMLLATDLPSCTISMLNDLNVRDIVEDISTFCRSQAAGDSAVSPIVVAASSPTSSPSVAAPSGGTVSQPSDGKKRLRKKNCHS